VAPDAGRASHLAAEDTLAERDLCRCCPGGSRKNACRLRAGVRVNAFGRPRLLKRGYSPSVNAWGGCRRGLDPRYRGSAPEDDSSDASVRVVCDVERAVIEGNARAAGTADLDAIAEADVDIGTAVAGGTWSATRNPLAGGVPLW
jgi:hypothetical protein